MQNLPHDGSRATMQITPSVVALEETYDTSVSTTTELTLNTATTFVEVTAIGNGVFMKWGTSDASNSDFDEFIAAGTTRHYKVPIDSSTKVLYTAINFIEETASAKLVVIEK